MSDSQYTDLHPNTFFCFEYAPDGEFMGYFKRYSNANGSDKLVGFAAIPALDPMFSTDRSEIHLSPHRFENLGYNILIDAYVGRLIEPKAAHG